MEQEFIEQVLDENSQTKEYIINQEKLDNYLTDNDIIDDYKDLAREGTNYIVIEIKDSRTKNITNNTILPTPQTEQLKNSSFGATMRDFIDDFTRLAFVYDFIFGDGSLRAVTSELFDYLAKKGKGLPYLVLAGVLNRFKKSRKKEDK